MLASRLNGVELLIVLSSVRMDWIGKLLARYVATDVDRARVVVVLLILVA